jgi:diguanylate cyclase (GGDEF)-like protein
MSLALLALDSVADSVLVHTPEGELKFFNREAAAVMRMSVNEFAALGPWGWTERSATPGRQARVEKLRQDGELTFQVPHQGTDGEPRVTEVRSRWVKTEEGPLIVSIVRDVTREVSAIRALEVSTYHDPLTGLGNRRLLEERLASVVAGVGRHGDYSGVLCIDVDKFKEINDEHGHAAGDQALQLIAQRLKSSLRAGDVVTRFGGDEFVAVLPRLDARESLQPIAKKVAGVLEQPMDLDGRAASVTVSIGGIIVDPDDGVGGLMHRVDLVMYRAKRSGEARVQVDID